MQEVSYITHLCVRRGGKEEGTVFAFAKGVLLHPASLHLTSFRASEERMLLTPMLSLFLLKSLNGCFLARSVLWHSVWSHKYSNWCPGHADTAAEVANMGKHQHLVSKEVQIEPTGQGFKPEFEVGPAFGQALN